MGEKMKKRTALIAGILIILFSSFRASAVNNIDEYNRKIIDASGAGKLSECLEKETRELLRKMGAGDIDPAGMMNISLGSVLETVSGVFKGSWRKPFRGMITCCAAAMLTAIFCAVMPEDEKMRSAAGFAGGCFAVIVVAVPAYECVNSCVSCLRLCSDFEKALVPVLAAVLTASGRPASALSFRGASLAASEIIIALSEKFMVPVCGAIGVLGICSGILPGMKLGGAAETLKKSATGFFTVCASLFSGFIALKSRISSSADKLGVKALKLVNSVFVPVVGGVLNEAYSSFSASLAAVKNTVGVFGIFAFAALILPVISETVLWIAALRASAVVSDLTGAACCTQVFTGIAYIFSMINTMLLLTAFVFIVSAGTVIMISAGE